KWAAWSAWRNAQGYCGGMNCPHSFKEGFRSGFIDVANGGTGCPPAFPNIPRCNHMWMDFCSGSEKIQASYDRYENGATMAKGQGMADVNRVVTRIPHVTPADYSMPSTTQPGAATPMLTDPAVPPAPLEEAAPTSPQTLRLPPSVFE